MLPIAGYTTTICLKKRRWMQYVPDAKAIRFYPPGGDDFERAVERHVYEFVKSCRQMEGLSLKNIGYMIGMSETTLARFIRKMESKNEV